MNKKIENLILFLGIIFAFFLRAGFALALEIQYPTVFGQSINDTSTLPAYVCYLFGLLINLAIIVAVIVVAFGGVYYLVSFSRSKFTTEAKDWIKAGLLGLLISVCSTLIILTINPDLTTCKLGVLALINIPAPTNSNSSLPLATSLSTYKEIPIGVLTETLLTRTMDCYGFDQNGNPVDGDTANGQSQASPTYVDHDRADCLAQLIDGAQKKAQVIASLSDAITKMMNTCSCQGKCDPTCDTANGGCQVTSSCPSFPTGTCGGPCVGAACKQPAGSKDCCPSGVKDKIEHGPVSITANITPKTSGTNCETTAINYNGLDEFRCGTTLSSSNSNAGFISCDGSDIVNFVEKQAQINNETTTVISQDNWKKLNLLQQLTYFKEKISQWESDSKIKDDVTVLDQAKSALAKCYWAIPSVDLAKAYQNADQQSHVILTEKTFSDPVTGDKIDASKYCIGFNYANSSCLKKCNDICPDTSTLTMQCYAGCGTCAIGDTSCQTQQQTCIKKCYTSRACPYGNSNSQNFGACMTSCQSDCSTSCAKKYIACSSEYDFCNSQCKDNGQCVLDNSDSCLFNSSNFQNCGAQATDQGNANYCINNAYLCKNGSDEYAGYSDCEETTAYTATDCSSLTNESDCLNETDCTWNGQECLQNYSSSFFYDNPDSEKCYNSKDDAVEPYSFPDKNSSCYSSKSKSLCIDVCPETAKCPANSKCPDCPCDQIDQIFSFDVPNASVPASGNTTGSGASSGSGAACLCPTGVYSIDCCGTSSSTGATWNGASGSPNGGNEGYTTEELNISAYQMVGPQCNSYSYNDDPLNFYCEDKPWDDPNSNASKEIINGKPLGTGMICPKSGEVPVGQTVDDAENWANGLKDSADKMGKDVQATIDQMTKIGKAKDTDPIQNYCGCGAKFDNDNGGGPICKSGCQFS